MGEARRKLSEKQQSQISRNALGKQNPHERWVLWTVRFNAARLADHTTNCRPCEVVDSRVVFSHEKDGPDAAI